MIHHLEKYRELHRQFREAEGQWPDFGCKLTNSERIWHLHRKVGGCIVACFGQVPTLCDSDPVRVLFWNEGANHEPFQSYTALANQAWTFLPPAFQEFARENLPTDCLEFDKPSRWWTSLWVHLAWYDSWDDVIDDGDADHICNPFRASANLIERYELGTESPKIPSREHTFDGAAIPFPLCLPEGLRLACVKIVATGNLAIGVHRLAKELTVDLYGDSSIGRAQAEQFARYANHLLMKFAHMEEAIMNVWSELQTNDAPCAHSDLRSYVTQLCEVLYPFCTDHEQRIDVEDLREHWSDVAAQLRRIEEPESERIMERLEAEFEKANGRSPVCEPRTSVGGGADKKKTRRGRNRSYPKLEALFVSWPDADNAEIAKKYRQFHHHEWKGLNLTKEKIDEEFVRKRRAEWNRSLEMRKPCAGK